MDELEMKIKEKIKGNDNALLDKEPVIEVE
jgi:hypothetical protein